MTGYAFRRYDQFETFPETIEQEYCDLQFANGGRFKANYSVDDYVMLKIWRRSDSYFFK